MLINIDTLIEKLEERSRNADRDPYSNTPDIDRAVSETLAILVSIFTELQQDSVNK